MSKVSDGFSGRTAMPGVILAVTPKSETSSAMSFNYVVRSVGYSLGSAIGGLVLAAGTATGRLFPNDDAYTTAALVGVAAERNLVSRPKLHAAGWLHGGDLQQDGRGVAVCDRGLRHARELAVTRQEAPERFGTLGNQREILR